MLIASLLADEDTLELSGENTRSVQRGRELGNGSTPAPANPDRADSTLDDLYQLELTTRETSSRETETIGKYSLLAKLGQGGMGVVYKAWDPDLKREVALKCMRAGVIEGTSGLQRFLREGAALAKINHAHIIRVYDAGQHHGLPFLVMELAARGTLANRLRDGAMVASAAAQLVGKIAGAVAHLHAKGLVHRDLKPGNVLLNEHDEPLLSDFGLIKSVTGDLTLTQQQHGVGTPAYMAPEQTGLLPESVGPAVDCWALGVLLYELLIGQKPFLGETRAELFHQILYQEPGCLGMGQTGMDRDLQVLMPALPGEGSGPALTCKGSGR